MRWFSSIGGVIATGAAALVLVSLPTDAQVDESAPPPIEAVPEVEPVDQSFVEEQPAEPDLDVPELGDSIADVLADSGYTQFVGSEDPRRERADRGRQVVGVGAACPVRDFLMLEVFTSVRTHCFQHPVSGGAIGRCRSLQQRSINQLGDDIDHIEIAHPVAASDSTSPVHVESGWED